MQQCMSCDSRKPITDFSNKQFIKFKKSGGSWQLRCKDCTQQKLDEHFIRQKQAARVEAKSKDDADKQWYSSESTPSWAREDKIDKQWKSTESAERWATEDSADKQWESTEFSHRWATEGEADKKWKSTDHWNRDGGADNQWSTHHWATKAKADKQWQSSDSTTPWAKEGIAEKRWSLLVVDT